MTAHWAASKHSYTFTNMVLTFFPLKNSPPNKISSSFSGCAHREAFNLRRARAVNQEQTRDSHLYTRARTWGTVGDTSSPTPASFSRPETEILLLTPLNPPNSIKHRIKLWHLCWFSVLSVNGGIKLTHLLSFWSFWYFLLHFSGCFLRSFHFLFFLPFLPILIVLRGTDWLKRDNYSHMEL